MINGDISYSSNDFLKMQQDAVTRVREMQKKAQEKIAQTNQISSTTNNIPISQNNNFSQMQNNFQPPKLKEVLGANLNNTVENLSALPKKALSSLSSVLENMGIDNDRLLIILLILILANDDGDKNLILALAYLLF